MLCVGSVLASHMCLHPLAPASVAAEALTDPVHTLHDLVCPSCCACVVLILLTAKCTYPLIPPTNPAPPCSHC